MAATLEDIKHFRENFNEEIVIKYVPLFEEMSARMDTLVNEISASVESFSESKDVAHTVGDSISAKGKPTVKLQRVRQAIYSNAKIVTRFRANLFNKLYSINADAKSLHSTIWTEMMGDEVTLTFLTTNADKEREVTYAMLPIDKIFDKMKTAYTTSRNNVEWISENLDHLNKIESALRLEHNMKMTLNDIGDEEDDDLGDGGTELLESLEETDIQKKPTSTPKGSTVVMEQGYDPLDDDEAYPSAPAPSPVPKKEETHRPAPSLKELDLDITEL